MRHARAVLLAAAAILATATAPAAIAQRTGQAVSRSNDPVLINRVIDEGMNRSEVMETAQYLTDRIGSRMTNSPGMRAAERWTQERFRAWGLQNVHQEGFEFGRGWSINANSARMIAPRPLQLRTIPVAWTPATNGAVTAPVIVAPMSSQGDFARYRGQLRGKIVLVTRPDSGSEPDEPAFRRLTDERLANMNTYRQPRYNPADADRGLARNQFAQQMDAFLAEEGAVAWVRMSRLDAGLVHGEGYLFRADQTARVPAVEMAAEDYRRLARLARTDAAPTLELNNDVRFHDEDRNAYNIIADIPGTDPRAGYVMAGAHLDSWAAADGAADNGAGSVVVMEAARIISRLGIRTKRTIRFALWNAEEEGLLGSLAYVTQHLASRPASSDPRTRGLGEYIGWRNRFPITPLPGHRDLAAYFNLDNGSGKIRGIYAEGNVGAVPIFQEWLAPFAGMGASTVSIQSTGGTDHVFMQSVGLPGFQFIQDPLDYGSRIHHTSIDTYDHLKAEDLRQAAVIMAAFLINAANADQPLPRGPVPQQPRDTDPFGYPSGD